MDKMEHPITSGQTNGGGGAGGGAVFVIIQDGTSGITTSVEGGPGGTGATSPQNDGGDGGDGTSYISTSFPT